jgi:hypothetical protein
VIEVEPGKPRDCEAEVRPWPWGLCCRMLRQRRRHHPAPCLGDGRDPAGPCRAPASLAVSSACNPRVPFVPGQTDSIRTADLRSIHAHSIHLVEQRVEEVAHFEARKQCAETPDSRLPHPSEFSESTARTTTSTHRPSPRSLRPSRRQNHATGDVRCVHIRTTSARFDASRPT